MASHMKNPFSGFTQIAADHHFTGRKRAIEEISSMVIWPEIHEPISNVAIVGMHGIGKSSLIRHLLTIHHQDLLNKRRLPIWINLKEYKNKEPFFFDLIASSIKELIKFELLDESILQFLLTYKSQDASFWINFPANIKEFFTEVHEAGINILFVLEEFDYARILFANDDSAFETLRQLSQGHHVNYITLSRRTITHIVTQAGAGSPLDNNFAKHYLAPFDDKDIQEYFEIFQTIGLTLSTKARQQILFYCGGHPYLLNMLGYKIIETFHHQAQITVEEAYNQMKTSFDHFFENIIKRLREDQGIHALLQVTFGPTIDITQKDINELQSYGIIKMNTDQKLVSDGLIFSAYTCFAESFQSYLSDLGRKVELFPMLGELEVTLRDSIADKLQKKYSAQWLNELSKHYAKEFRNYAQIQDRDRKTGKAGSSENILDYTYLWLLFDIMLEKYWDIFGPIFQTIPQKNKQYWKERANLIAEVRNPVMHIRIKSITANIRLHCEEYCQEFLQAIAAEVPKK